MSESPESNPPDERSHVLVLDREREVLDEVAGILGREFAVETCGSTVVAGKLLTRSTFDVLCIDDQLAGESALDLVATFVEAGVVVGVVMTTNRFELRAAELHARSELQAAIPIMLLTRPHRPQDLLDAVRRASSFARVRRALRGMHRRTPTSSG